MVHSVKRGYQKYARGGLLVRSCAGVRFRPRVLRFLRHHLRLKRKNLALHNLKAFFRDIASGCDGGKSPAVLLILFTCIIRCQIVRLNHKPRGKKHGNACPCKYARSSFHHMRPFQKSLPHFLITPIFYHRRSDFSNAFYCPEKTMSAALTHHGHCQETGYLNFTAVPYAMTSAAPCMTAADA